MSTHLSNTALFSKWMLFDAVTNDVCHFIIYWYIYFFEKCTQKCIDQIQSFREALVLPQFEEERDLFIPWFPKVHGKYLRLLPLKKRNSNNTNICDETNILMAFETKSIHHPWFLTASRTKFNWNIKVKNELVIKCLLNVTGNIVL